MNKEKFDTSKTHANIGTIGHVGYGKTTLTKAINMVLNEYMKERSNINISTKKENEK